MYIADFLFQQTARNIYALQIYMYISKDNVLIVYCNI